MNIALVPYVQKNPDSFLSAALEYWLEKNEIIMTFEHEYPKQCFRVKYEDLVANPGKILDPMFAFLEVEWDVSLLDSVFSTHHDEGPGDPKLKYTTRIKSDSIGRGTMIPYKQIPKLHLSRINRAHERLGYQSVESFYGAYHTKVTQSSTRTISETALSGSREEVFDILKERAEHFETLDDECKLVVTGKNGGMWMCGPKAPHARALETDEKASCVIVLSYESLMDILNHDQNPLDVYDQGKIRVTGDLEMAEQFGRTLLVGL